MRSLGLSLMAAMLLTTVASFASPPTIQAYQKEIQLRKEITKQTCELGAGASGISIEQTNPEPNVEIRWSAPVPKAKGIGGWDYFSKAEFGLTVYLCPGATDVANRPGQFDIPWDGLTPDDCREIVLREEIRGMAYYLGLAPHQGYDARIHSDKRRMIKAGTVKDNRISQVAHFSHESLACAFGFSALLGSDGYLVIAPIELDDSYNDSIKGMTTIVKLSELRQKKKISVELNGVQSEINFQVFLPRQ